MILVEACCSNSINCNFYRRMDGRKDYTLMEEFFILTIVSIDVLLYNILKTNTSIIV